MDGSLTSPQARLPVSGCRNEDVRRCVVHQEWLERIVPRTVFWSLFGTAALMLLSRYSWHVTGGVLVGAVGALIVARLAVAIAVGVVLRPSRNFRFRSAAKKLGSRLKAAGDLSCPPCTWYTGAPGAFALTKGGELLLADRSSGYELLRLTADLIAGVSVEREFTQVTETRHSGRTVIGGVGGGLFGGWVSGGWSTSVSREAEEAYLEIRYQLEANGPVAVAVAPFGADRRAADSACAMIRRAGAP
ncbi:MAG TPA: hypothetical protein VF574_08215 [Allosphingosinicella sp.]|jgi:hypothetical protein